jgi:hypothetical protein
MSVKVKSGNLFGRMNNPVCFLGDLLQINYLFLLDLSRCAKTPEMLENSLSARDFPLYRMYRFVMGGEGIKYDAAREKMFEGIDTRRRFYCRTRVR